jgi:hypothetical protein
MPNRDANPCPPPLPEPHPKDPPSCHADEGDEGGGTSTLSVKEMKR